MVVDEGAHIPTLPDDYIPDAAVMPRKTQDNVINGNGRMLIDFCRETGTRI